MLILVLAFYRRPRRIATRAAACIGGGFKASGGACRGSDTPFAAAPCWLIERRLSDTRSDDLQRDHSS
jgi:hypothetical protein